mgnify:CR=1 FL=1
MRGCKNFFSTRKLTWQNQKNENFHFSVQIRLKKTQKNPKKPNTIWLTKKKTRHLKEVSFQISKFSKKTHFFEKKHIFRNWSHDRKSKKWCFKNDENSIKIIGKKTGWHEPIRGKKKEEGFCTHSWNTLLFSDKTRFLRYFTMKIFFEKIFLLCCKKHVKNDNK